MLYQSIEGHNAQRAFLQRIFCAKRLPPAMLLAGESGIGKKLVAYELIHSIFCERCNFSLSEDGKSLPAKHYGGCGKCKSCLLVTSRNMPDFFELNCEDKTQTNVEVIRELLYSLHLKPFAAPCRVVFFDNAEYLNQQSANVLLKALEEPRPATFYILTCANPHKLPATLLSRCQTWHFDSLTSEQVKTVLLAKKIFEEKEIESDMSLDDLCMIADGSLENIRELADGIQGWRECQNNLLSVAAGSIPLALEFASELSKDKLSLRSKLRLIRSFARYQLQHNPTATECSSWARLLLDIVGAERLIFQRNLAPVHVLSAIFVRLAEGIQFISLTTSKLDVAAASFTVMVNNATFLEEQILG